jgi:DNA-directed RNA polymerase specialized sigma subunit
LGTINDNQQDMKLKSRNKRGEQHHNAKLKEEDIGFIRWLYFEGFFQKVIAKMFGTSQTAISKIVTHKRWAFL